MAFYADQLCRINEPFYGESTIKALKSNKSVSNINAHCLFTNVQLEPNKIYRMAIIEVPTRRKKTNFTSVRNKILEQGNIMRFEIVTHTHQN